LSLLRIIFPSSILNTNKLFSEIVCLAWLLLHCFKERNFCFGALKLIIPTHLSKKIEIYFPDFSHSFFPSARSRKSVSLTLQSTLSPKAGANV
jgi:hypothetical protein